MKFKIIYEDRTGKKYEDEQVFEFPNSSEDKFQGSAIRKAVLLTRYINFMKVFVMDIASHKTSPTVNTINGIPVPGSFEDSKQHTLGKLSPEYHALFDKFVAYFSSEADVLGDPTLINELELIQKIKKLDKKKNRGKTL